MAAGEMVELRRWAFPEVQQLVMRVRGPNGEEIPQTYYAGEERRNAFLLEWFPGITADPGQFTSQSFTGLPARAALLPGGTLRAQVPAWVTIFQGLVILFGHSGDLPRFRLQANENDPQQPVFAIWDSWGYANGPDGLVPDTVSGSYLDTEARCQRLETYDEVPPDAVLLGYLREPVAAVTPPVELPPIGTVTVVEKVSLPSPAPDVVPAIATVTGEERQVFDPVAWARGR